MKMKNIPLCLLTVLIPSIFIQEVHSKSHHGQSAMNNLGIIGGKNTTIEQHPYQVALLQPAPSSENNNLFFVCGGSIISPRFILTAAHCVLALENCPFVYVRVGSTQHKSGGTLIRTLRRVAHPLFNWNALDFDVGFIELEKNITLDGKTKKVISLPPLGTSAPVPAGTNITVTGWGMTSMDNHNGTNQLMEVTLPTITNERCDKEYTTRQRITPRMICAGFPTGNKTACHGDSGGPAVDESSGVQLGVVSFGTPACLPGFATVFANLSSPDIRSWIKKNTGV